ncbi:MAG: hypothetical protein U1E61_04885 [Bradyrhizobium sp.]
MAADATIAISEGGTNKLLQDALSLAHASDSDSGSWGPFTVGYSVSVNASGGNVELVDTPVEVIRLHDVLISGSVGVSFDFDLGNILPQICIPPVRICVNIPFIGRVCTPQFCIPWPHVHVAPTLPFAVNFSADFDVKVQNGGSTWDIVLLVYPFSIVIDPSPMADLLLDAIKQKVHDLLDPFPIVGSVIADIIDTVISTLQGVLDAIFQAIDALIHEVILLLDVFSPTIPFKLVSFKKVQAFLPAGGPGDNEVDVNLISLSAHIAGHELISEGAIA